MKWNLIIAVLGMVCASAQAGNELGNGGDVYAKEFVSLGRGVLEKMKASPDSKIPDFDAFAKAIEETRVVTEDNLELEGATVDAINYPQSKRIELNRRRWREYDNEERSALVLHEYLGVARIDDSRYQISGTYSGSSAEINLDPYMYGQRSPWSVGAGTGIDSYLGNIGKLYEKSGAKMDFRVAYMVSPYFIIHAGMDKSEAAFNAQETGTVGVSLLKEVLVAQYHPFQTKRWTGGAGFDPYFLVGVGEVQRTQAFQTLNKVEKD
ncbi:MAG: hypothetical protein ACXWQO_07560, partial [Bdellovibrionota bacterium]